MEVYVANETLQHRELHFRIPGRDNATVMAIRAGRQEKLPGDYDGATLASIIKQLETAGGIPENDLNAIKRPHTLLYRVSRRIEADTIDEARALDIEARQEVAGDKMEESGLRAFGSTKDVLRQNGMGDAAETLQETSVEIREVTDVKEVKDGVNFETIVSQKPGRAGRLNRSEKRG